MRDIRQTPKYAEYLEKIGWKVEKTGKVHTFIRKLSFFGSVLKIQRPEEIDIDAFNFIRKKYKAFQTIIEPKSTEHQTLITEHGYKHSKSPYLPTKTLHLDLTKTTKELFAQLKKDTRYSLRKTRDVNVYEVERAWEFRNAWRLAVDLRRWVPSISHLQALKKTFGEDALFLVTPGGESGAIFLHTRDKAYYWQAFSDKRGREGLYQYKILWAGISWAKARKAKIFDFEGIYDERFPNKKWKGFTHFKKSFGGIVVEYPGAFIKTMLPF
ncbi:peptidoglycan bridge formation glycyltransferase FemA/FemB family protein [Patescibacteria group bacterium]|nr:peptidoglycan bridge formation glycyltransferase FemA/FemB family protein [Patescibacteria group bacterium]